MPTANLIPFVIDIEKTRSKEILDVLGVPVLIKVSGEDTNNQMAQFYVPVPPMSGPPLHRHSREEEYFYVIDGEITWQLNGERFSGGAGTTAFAPRGSIHTFQNFGKETAHMLVTVTPAGLEKFFEEVHNSKTNVDFAMAEQIMNNYGIEVVGPPLV